MAFSIRIDPIYTKLALFTGYVFPKLTRARIDSADTSTDYFTGLHIFIFYKQNRLIPDNPGSVKKVVYQTIHKKSEDVSHLTYRHKHKKGQHCMCWPLAESEGFEPPVPLRVLLISNQTRSTTPAALY